MSSTSNHLPTPYEIAGHYIRTARGARIAGVLDGHLVAELDHTDPRWKETAEFIVRACNSYKPMADALQVARKALAGPADARAHERALHVVMDALVVAEA